MWKDEVSSTAFRHIPKITNDNPCEKGGATRKKVMKSRIPWWPELLDKKKDHIGGTEGTEEDQHDEIHDDENDVFYDSVRDLKDLDSNHKGDVAISNKDDEDNLCSLRKQLGERVKTLNDGKNLLDMISRDNNASDSGIDEDEEYHDSLEDIETAFRSEESVL